MASKAQVGDDAVEVGVGGQRRVLRRRPFAVGKPPEEPKGARRGQATDPRLGQLLLEGRYAVTEGGHRAIQVRLQKVTVR
jgi:hypothetical protein